MKASEDFSTDDQADGANREEQTLATPSLVGEIETDSDCRQPEQDDRDNDESAKHQPGLPASTSGLHELIIGSTQVRPKPAMGLATPGGSST
jgi:hypothetical protein